MTVGSFVAYRSVADEWHIFQITDPPRYGREEYEGGIGLSVGAVRVSTRSHFWLPPNILQPCQPTAVQRDGTKIRDGESFR
jgi:hypothetical protein